MASKKTPLHYAILKLFTDNRTACAEDVVRELQDEYGNYKLLNADDVDETLATAKENGLLDEVACDLGDQGELRISYRINEFGLEMITKYI